MKKRIGSFLLALAFCGGLSIPAAAAFADVPATHWASGAIEYVTDKGLFNGTGADTFSPDTVMTRSMLTQVLYRYAGFPAVQGSVKSETTYMDISDDAYYADAAVWAVQNDIFPMWFLYDSRDVDDAAQKFQPNKVVNRAEFTYMLSSFASKVMPDRPKAEVKSTEIYDYISNSDSVQFKDMTKNALYASMPDVASYAIEGDTIYSIMLVMLWGYKDGILTGTTTSTMSPEMSVTRAQAAAMLMRFCEKFEAPSDKEPTVPEPSSVKIVTDHVTNNTLTVGDYFWFRIDVTPSGVDYDYDIDGASGSSPIVELDGTAGTWQIWNAVSVGTYTISVTTSDGASDSVTITVLPKTTETNNNNSSGTDAQTYISEVIRLVNEERAKEGLPALQTNDTINGAAQIRAAELPALFAHDRPDGSTCFTALDDADIRYWTAGENIAAGYATPEAVVNGWMNSDGHRANILNKSFTTIGVGYNGSGNYWVQLFVG